MAEEQVKQIESDEIDFAEASNEEVEVTEEELLVDEETQEDDLLCECDEEQEEESFDQDEDEDEDEDEEDLYEVEYSDDDIAYLIVDEDDNEIGFALYDEEGNEVEYLYADDEVEVVKPPKKKSEKEARADKVIESLEETMSSENVKNASKDFGEVYKAGKEVTGELKETVDDLKSLLDFKSMFK